MIPPATRLLSPRSLLLQPLPHSASDTSLAESSSASTHLPTSVVERKSRTARPHLSSATLSQRRGNTKHTPDETQRQKTPRLPTDTPKSRDR